MNESQTCGLCAYFVPRESPKPHGKCRRMPPVAMNKEQSMYPTVGFESPGCGEFEAREIQPVKNPTEDSVVLNREVKTESDGIETVVQTPVLKPILPVIEPTGKPVQPPAAKK